MRLRSGLEYSIREELFTRKRSQRRRRCRRNCRARLRPGKHEGLFRINGHCGERCTVRAKFNRVMQKCPDVSLLWHRVRATKSLAERFTRGRADLPGATLTNPGVTYQVTSAPALELSFRTDEQFETCELKNSKGDFCFDDLFWVGVHVTLKDQQHPCGLFCHCSLCYNNCTRTRVYAKRAVVRRDVGYDFDDVRSELVTMDYGFAEDLLYETVSWNRPKGVDKNVVLFISDYSCVELGVRDYPVRPSAFDELPAKAESNGRLCSVM